MEKKKLSITLPELVIFAVTRGAIGVGAGLLIANKLSAKQRQAVGWPLFIAGLLSTIPIASRLFGKGERGRSD